MKHELTTLKNNLKTLFVNSPGSTAATVQIWFRAGSALEEHDHQGIAHFLEHMFFKGTVTRPGAQIAHEVETFGGEINAFTSFDYTCYYINTPNTQLSQTIDILLDMVANPMFKLEDLLPERDVVFEEYRRSIDSPSQFAFAKLQESVFTGKYAHQILGREETIKNFSQEQLHFFRNAYYNLSNALLIVAGDIEAKDSIVKTIEKYKLPDGKQSDFSEFSLKKNQATNVHQKEVGMATMTMVIQAPEYNHATAPSEDLALNCIGFGETSRLYKDLVLDNTIANVASASTMFMAKGGAHFIRIVFPIENLNNVINTFFKTIQTAIEEGLNADEVQKIKNQYLSSKIYELESIESFAFSLGHSFAQTGNINCENDFIERIKATTPFQVNQALKNIFSKEIHIGLQIPQNASTQQAKKSLEKFKKESLSLKKLIQQKSVNKYQTVKSKYDNQVKLIKIKPGVSLVYRQNLMTPTFVLQAYLRGGLTDETEQTNGMYHLLSSLLTKGYKNNKFETIKKHLEESSSSISGFTGKNSYGLLMHGLSDNFHSLLPHFQGALLTPDIPQKFLKQEKLLVSRALINQKQDPVKQCFKEANRIFFNKHPYSNNPIGSEKSLKKLSQENLKSKHKKNLKNEELLITYCGDLELDAVLKSFESFFKELPSRKSKKLQFKKYKPLLNQNVKIKFDREQTQILYGIPCGKLGSAENIYLKMLNAHLSGQSSELFVDVRDRKGLCYSAQPIHFSAIEGGYFGIYMASGHDKVDAALVAIKELIEKIKVNGILEDEFKRIKEMIKGQNLLNVQTNEDYASVYSIPVLQSQGLDYYHEGNKEIEELKYSDFQKNIKKILSAKWSTVIVGR
jgi:zinc protease